VRFRDDSARDHQEFDSDQPSAAEYSIAGGSTSLSPFIGVPGVARPGMMCPGMV
jgi:hypothetical protein